MFARDMYLSLQIPLGMKEKNLHPAVNNDLMKEEEYALKRLEIEAIASRIIAAAEVTYSWCVRYSI
jgi:hypothetical protein